MSYRGSWKIDDYLTFCCNTHDPDTGVATDADAVPTYRVYEDETGTPILTGSMAKLDDANTTGFYSERIQLTAANGFEKGKCYTIHIAATVDTDPGTTHHFFQIEAEVDANTASDLHADLDDGGRLDLLIDAIKAVTDNLPNSGSLSDLATILTDTNELQTDWVNGGRLDLLIDAIKAVTDALPNAGALSDLATILTDTNELQTDWVNGGRLDLLIDAITTHLTDVKGATFAGATDSLEAIRNRGDAAWTTGAGGDATEAKQDTIIADTNELQTDWVNGGRLDLLIDAIKAVTDKTDNTLEDNAGTYRFTEAALAQAPTGGAGGSGAITFVYTLTSSVDSTPVDGATVWATTDQAGNNVVASGTTNTSGEVTFYLDAGTYYVWRQKSGWNFANPDTETVA